MVFVQLIFVLFAGASFSNGQEWQWSTGDWQPVSNDQQWQPISNDQQWQPISNDQPQSTGQLQPSSGTPTASSGGAIPTYEQNGKIVPLSGADIQTFLTVHNNDRAAENANLPPL